MMKMHYKKIGLAFAFLGVFSAVTVLAYDDSKETKAQLIQDRKESREEVRAQNVCERLSQLVDNLNQKATDGENKVKTHQQERFANWENKTSEADYEIESLRTSWDENRDAQFSKLEEKAKTDVQEKAVSDFKASVKTAIAARRSAMDAATEAFRAGVKKAIETRQDQVEGIVSSSTSSRVAALAKVKADCEAGKDVATVRASFKNGMKSARTQMQNDRQNVDKVSTTVKNLVQVRRTATEKAMSDFKASMEKARVALKAAFADENADDETTTDTEEAN